MKVRIEFELDALGSADSNQKIVDILLEKWTAPIRFSRFLIPGTWKIDY